MDFVLKNLAKLSGIYCSCCTKVHFAPAIDFTKEALDEFLPLFYLILEFISTELTAIKEFFNLAVVVKKEQRPWSSSWAFVDKFSLYEDL